MVNLKFADTHNMVTFLSKPEESDGFEQIVDFLNAYLIKYAITVNPTIYISCIEQFWSTVKAKTINGEVQLHALVDGKKIIITESTIRRDLQLEDAEGVDCLPNSTIFEQLTLMGPKTTAWNEFSSTMASAIICLATNQKFNFSKFIFKGMIKNLDNVSGKFLMYPRFVQVFLNQQLDGLPTHKRIYNAPSHTKKIFRNMRRVGKGFSGRVTPLFQTMVVQNQSELGERFSNITVPLTYLPVFQYINSTSKRHQKPRKPKRKYTQVPQPSDPSENVVDEAIHKELGDSLVRAATTVFSLEAKHDSGNITKTRSKATPNKSSSLGTTSGGGPRVLDLENTKTTQANEIASLKRRITKLEKKNKSRTHKLKSFIQSWLTARVDPLEMRKFGVRMIQIGRINAIDADDDITLVSVQDDADKEMFNVDDLNVRGRGDVCSSGKMKNVLLRLVKGKGILIEPVEPMKKKDLIRLDKEVALKLQVEFDKEERLAREKAEKEQEANIALIETWDDIQAKIDADHQLAKRLQAREQEELSVEEKGYIISTTLSTRDYKWKQKVEDDNEYIKD
ncbi:hypothetical protein Tco_0809383 [Tanacetum coccineum]